MQKKIGKFVFYVPEVEALDVLKAIFSQVDSKKMYSGNPTKYHSFFVKAKDQEPNVFKDVFIDQDTFLPYSEDMEQAFSLAQDYRIISRPNPDIYSFEIKASKERLKQDIKGKFSSKEMAAIKKIAKLFEKELQEVA